MVQYIPCSCNVKILVYQLLYVISFVGAFSLIGSFVVDGTGLIVLDNLVCTGSESRLIDCPHSGLGNHHNCDHSQDVGVRCIGRPIVLQLSSDCEALKSKISALSTVFCLGVLANLVKLWPVAIVMAICACIL